MESPAEHASLAPAGVTPAAPLRRPGIWSGLGIVALYFALQFGLSILIGIVIGAGVMMRAGIVAGVQHRKLHIHAIMQALRTNPDMRVVLTVITIAVAAAIMAALVRQFWPGQWSRAELPGFGFTRPRSPLAYVAAAGLAIVVMLIGGVIARLAAHGHPFHQDVTVMASEVPLDLRILLALLVVCVAPFVEELVFRGVLLSGLARRMPIAWAVVVSAVIFGCAHLPDFKFAWYPIPALFLLGLLLAWLRVRTGSIWPSITAHATNNFIAALAWFLAAHH
ncbi:MAG TPA: CPBP family intramembrane glutamic endopeptidase [Rhodanobacteraceae bacterium]